MAITQDAVLRRLFFSLSGQTRSDLHDAVELMFCSLVAVIKDGVWGPVGATGLNLDKATCVF